MLKYLRSNPITYSQYFLAKRHLAEQLVGMIPLNLLNRYPVVEIGPGTGRLTEFLAMKSRELTAIEVDYNFWKNLSEKFSHSKNVKILCGDFMDFKLANECIIVSNLPYFLARTMIMKMIRSQKVAAAYVIIESGLENELKKSQLDLGISITVLSRLRRADFVPMPRVESVFVEIRIK
jgi:16S rRNA (adenine1518-N6/adenine1519-N6)-dimethyltransferase